MSTALNDLQEFAAILAALSPVGRQRLIAEAQRLAERDKADRRERGS